MTTRFLYYVSLWMGGNEAEIESQRSFVNCTANLMIWHTSSLSDWASGDINYLILVPGNYSRIGQPQSHVMLEE